MPPEHLRGFDQSVPQLMIERVHLFAVPRQVAGLRQGLAAGGACVGAEGLAAGSAGVGVGIFRSLDVQQALPKVVQA